jgi:hypothetical protein
MPATELPDNNGQFGLMGANGLGDENGYPLYGRGKMGSGRSTTLPAVTKAEVSSIEGNKIYVIPSGFLPGDLCILYKSNGEYERCRIQTVGEDYVMLLEVPKTVMPTGYLMLVKVLEVHEMNIDGPLVNDDIVIPITARYVHVEVPFESNCHVILWAERIDPKPEFALLELITS